MTDAELLRAWSGERCEDSFRTLVTKYLGLVENVAMRRTGDAALLKDVAQTVFTRLAANADSVHPSPTLAPWLHQCALRTAIDALRSEITRHRHLKAYS